MNRRTERELATGRALQMVLAIGHWSAYFDRYGVLQAQSIKDHDEHIPVESPSFEIAAHNDNGLVTTCTGEEVNVQQGNPFDSTAVELLTEAYFEAEQNRIRFYTERAKELGMSALPNNPDRFLFNAVEKALRNESQAAQATA